MAGVPWMIRGALSNIFGNSARHDDQGAMNGPN